MKYDQDCGPMGMQTLSDIVRSMDKNPNIHAIILRIDSPGGTVAGTQELGDAVAGTSKPVIAITEDLMASAAYWVGSKAKELYASKELDEIGSIGVMTSFADAQPYYERMGVKFHTILADQSKDKNKMFADIQKGDYDQYKKEVLNPLADQFIKVVKESRPNVKEDQLTGKVFFARDVVGSLIDGIKSFDQVVKRAIELSDAKEKQYAVSPKIQDNSMKKTFLNLNKSVGAELEVADGGVFLTEDQAAQVDASLVPAQPDTTALTTAQTERDAAIAQRDSVTAERDTANTTIATRDARIAELEAEVTRLQGTAGATSARVAAKTEGISGEATDSEFTMEMSMEERLAKLQQLKSEK
jgi:signal peptide peptidase SppA